MNDITYGSVCSGIEAASVAWHPLGWRAAWFAEIEPFPSAVLAHRFPGVPNLGDMTAIAAQVRAGAVAAPDVLVGGTPCFTADHLVLTDVGYRPIQDIRPGDMVMTHAGRLRRVVRIGSKAARVGTLRAVGLPESLTVTPDHPFLAVDFTTRYAKRGGRAVRVEHCGEPRWVAASEMAGLQWCALQAYEPSSVAPRSTKFGAREAMYVAGMYLGDGHVRGWRGSKKKALILSLNPAKLEKLEAFIGRDAFSVTRERTSVRATICDTALCEWLEDQFGRLSHLKKLPAWVLGHEHRAELLRGYLDTDGCVISNGVGATTTSRALAYGIADLLVALGRVASVKFVKAPETSVIEGRVVNQRCWYQVRAYDFSASRKSRVRHGYLLRKVQSFSDTGSAVVFNIEVEGDNSYVVNGCVVHNCQAFSVAGLREGLSDPRGALTLAYCDLANAIDSARSVRGLPPVVTLWENVDGVLSSRDNAFGHLLAGLAGEDAAIDPGRGGWTHAGVVAGPRRVVAWRVLDAQGFVPQRRRRVFVVACGSADRLDPVRVLFEPEAEAVGHLGDRLYTGPLFPVAQGLPGHPAPRREPRQDAAADAACRADGGGRADAPVAFGGNNTSGSIEVAPALLAQPGSGWKGDFESETFVVQPVVYDTTQVTSAVNRANPRPGDPCHPLAAGGHAPLAVWSVTQDGCPQALSELSPTLKVGTGLDDVGGQPPCIADGLVVRRLTPVECERLQGFPDGWTQIPWRGKPASECPDGPRYKALGNSMATPVMAWLGRRIAEALA